MPPRENHVRALLTIYGQMIICNPRAKRRDILLEECIIRGTGDNSDSYHSLGIQEKQTSDIYSFLDCYKLLPIY